VKIYQITKFTDDKKAPLMQRWTRNSGVPSYASDPPTSSVISSVRLLAAVSHKAQ